MDVVTDVLVLRNGLEHIVSHILRVRRGESDAHVRHCLGNHRHEVREMHRAGLGQIRRLIKVLLESAAVPQVAVDVLSQEGNFFIALVRKVQCLVYDGLWVSRTLASTGKRHYTEGTHVITTTSDGNKGTYAISAQANRFNIVVSLFLAQDYIDRLTTAIELLQKIREIAVGIWSYDQVNQFFFFQQLSLHALRHTAQHAYFHVRVGFLVAVEMGQSVANGLFGFIANRTSVQQH